MEINLPFIISDKNDPKHLSCNLSREKLEDLIDELVKNTIKPCEITMIDVNEASNTINEIILVK